MPIEGIADDLQRRPRALDLSLKAVRIWAVRIIPLSLQVVQIGDRFVAILFPSPPSRLLLLGRGTLDPDAAAGEVDDNVVRMWQRSRPFMPSLFRRASSRFHAPL